MKSRNLESKIKVPLQNSSLYQEIVAEKDEVMRHKWIESEKIGYDVGYEKALFDWILNHRDAWRKSRRKTLITKR